MSEPLLAVRDLSIQFFTYQGVVRALENVNLMIQPGEIMGLVAKRGCGKSVMARSVLRLIPDPPGKITGGEILFKGEDILKAHRRRLREIPRQSHLHDLSGTHEFSEPVYTVGNQMERSSSSSRSEPLPSSGDCIQMLQQVKMPDPDAVLVNTS